MSDNSFDFGAMLDDQMKGIKRTYKFGKAFNDDKLIIRPKKQVVEVMSDDNATVKAAWDAYIENRFKKSKIRAFESCNYKKRYS